MRMTIMTTWRLKASVRKPNFINCTRFAGTAACVVIALACGYTLQAQQHINKDVPYVPTLPEIVDEMLRLANVGKNDVVYDLGCGDGRLIIAAVKKFGAKRGVGVDIDPERIRESNENALAAGVQHRVKFFEQDLFKTNIREATVVMLYLLPEVNLRLRPKLLAELKPGTRVVSNSFDMGDWKYEKIAFVGEQPIYFWTIPAKAVRREVVTNR
jgi:SAM-dependent methyltransferase